MSEQEPVTIEIAITGRQNSGKSIIAQEIAEVLLSHGLSVRLEESITREGSLFRPAHDERVKGMRERPVTIVLKYGLEFL